MPVASHFAGDARAAAEIRSEAVSITLDDFWSVVHQDSILIAPGNWIYYFRFHRKSNIQLL